MIPLNIKGLVAPVFTPTNEDGTVNFGMVQRYAAYLAAEGVKSVLVCGTSGEMTCLSTKERKSLSEAWVNSCVPFGMKVIVQVGGAAFPDVLELAKHAADIKADALLVLPELYYKPKAVEDLLDYLRCVSGAAPCLPIIYYHFPMMSGVNVNMKEFFGMASSTIPNFAGMKGDLGVALEVTDNLVEGRRVFIGNHLLAPAALLGHDSSIATVTNIFPKLVRDILAAVEISDAKKARTLQLKLNSLVTGISSQGDWVPSMKYAMKIVTNLDMGPPRLPLKILSEKQRTLIEYHIRRFPKEE